MSKNTRIKIFLFKNDLADDNDFLKEGTTKKYERIQVNNEYIYLYKTKESTPRWYKNFLLLNDNHFYNVGSSGYMIKKVSIEQEQYNFALSFGGADSSFDTSKFVDDFGLKICLSVVEKFSSISKSNISTTMSNNKEVSTKKDELNSFVLNVETDLLKGVSVKPRKEYQFGDGIISGSNSLSISTDSNIGNINLLLERLVNIYKSDNYKERYEFIDNIKLVMNKELETMIQENIFESIEKKEFEKVWFGSPDFDSWESVSGFSVEYNKKKKEYPDLYIEEITNDFELKEYKALNKIKVCPIYDDDTFAEPIKLSDCLYGEAKIDGNIYIINNNRYYLINHDYVKEVNKQYSDIQIIGNLPVKEKNMSEAKYNEYVAKKTGYELFDRRIFNIKNNRFELCDLYDATNSMFIHVKKYGSSSLLSHLFFQALNSAKYFKSNKKEVVDYYKDKYELKIPDSNQYQVAMAIISKEKINGRKKVAIPFFSKMSVVNTIAELKSMGYKAGLIFISTEIQKD